ncbi:MAG: sulfatase [Verrucomicrobiota bacterium]
MRSRRALLSILLVFFSAIDLGRGNEGPPNFVFFITDDISPEDLGCYGSEVVETPNLDAISERALVFERAYLTISSCSPSRCSIITGRYPHNTGAPELHSRLPADQYTFVQGLRDAGYHTFLSGKNHMGEAEDLGFAGSSDSKPAGSEKWVKHLRERPKDRPFFFWFGSHDAHAAFTIDDKAPVYDPVTVPVPPMLYDGPLTREELAGYYHEVSRTDYYAGEVMRELEAQGIADNTYFIYCADNGRPFPRCKTYLYDSGIRTPLIVAGPGLEAGRTDSMVSSVDFAATILDLAEVEIPETIQGVSFAAVLSDPTAEVRDVAFSERNWHVYRTHERAVRMGDWLYIWNAWPELHNTSGESSWTNKFGAAKELWDAAAAGDLSEAQALLTQAPQPDEMLFNVKEDPHQFVNLASDERHRETLERMRGLLALWQEETRDSVPSDPTPDREGLHGDERGKGSRKEWKHREFAGAERGATKVNAPGPVLVGESN